MQLPSAARRACGARLSATRIGRTVSVMNDATQTINSSEASRGESGQLRLAAGTTVALRMWSDEPPATAKAVTSRPYETVGYVLGGRAELHLGDTVIPLASGDSWVVPRDAAHTYRIIETFSALEATSPPAR
jgi:quercetin dioxygenase-like cupin family protein